MTTSIEVRGARRRYGGRDGFEAVRGVSFEVRRGELFALLGTDGAGKTSIMELIAGFTRPHDGTVRQISGCSRPPPAPSSDGVSVPVPDLRQPRQSRRR